MTDGVRGLLITPDGDLLTIQRIRRILEILAEQRLGHEVPGMRGLYARASD